MSKIKNIMNIFDNRTKEYLNKLPEYVLDSIVEIRIRCGRSIEVITMDNCFFIDELQNVTQHFIDEFVQKCCKYSLYSFQKDINKGFITLKGGHRVGVVGRFIEKDKSVYIISNISSINIRISKEVLHCANDIYDKLLKNEDANILICGEPLTGKTTILRDMSRILSDIKNKKVSIIDERDEIANTLLGENQNYVGKKVDVLSSYPKKIGICTAIRTMSPQYIICDEIGDEAEIDTLKNTVNAGCNIVASIHSSYHNKRKILNDIIETQIFDYLVFLDSYPIIGSLYKIIKIR